MNSVVIFQTDSLSRSLGGSTCFDNVAVMNDLVIEYVFETCLLLEATTDDSLLLVS